MFYIRVLFIYLFIIDKKRTTGGKPRLFTGYGNFTLPMTTIKETHRHQLGMFYIRGRAEISYKGSDFQNLVFFFALLPCFYNEKLHCSNIREMQN